MTDSKLEDIPMLLRRSGPQSGQALTIEVGGLGIGRAEDNGVVIDEDGVSRYHARLLFDNGSLWLQDSGSRNGVFVNGSRVTGHKALKVGDTVEIASHMFELCWSTDERLVQPAGSGAGAAGKQPVGGEVAEPGGAGSEAVEGNGKKRRWFWPFS